MTTQKNLAILIMRLTFGKDEVPGSNPGISSKGLAVMQVLFRYADMVLTHKPPVFGQAVYLTLFHCQPIIQDKKTIEVLA